MAIKANDVDEDLAPGYGHVKVASLFVYTITNSSSSPLHLQL